MRPWGIGAVLYGPSEPVAYLFDRVGDADCDRLHAQVGGPAFNTLREALAVVAALRARASRCAPDRPAEIRSGNLGVLYDMCSRAAPARDTNLSTHEIYVVGACVDFPRRVLRHIPRVAQRHS